MGVRVNREVAGIFVPSSYVYLPASDDVTRNSVNDATDDDEVTLGTVVVLPNNGAVRGSEFRLWSVWEHTNSANTKQLICRVNGGSVGSVNVTTGPTYFQRQPFDVYDDDNLITINSFGSAGTGGSGAAPFIQPIASLAVAGFTVTWSCKWTTQPISGEFIRLKACKVLQLNP